MSDSAWVRYLRDEKIVAMLLMHLLCATRNEKCGNYNELQRSSISGKRRRILVLWTIFWMCEFL
jgi:hypothetical protein